MVTGTLTLEMERSGAEVTRRLDEAGLDVKAAFWLFDAEHGAWRLMVATPKLKLDGPKHVYTAIQRALGQGDLDSLRLDDITVVAPDEPMVALLRTALRTGPVVSGIRFSRNTINGVFIEDAYVYRLM